LRQHRRGEEEGLAVSRKRVDNPADVRQESHVEHAIRLVEDEDLEAAEVDVASGHVVEETAGSRDDHVDASTEGVLLGRHPDAAVYGVTADPGPLGQATEGDLDLGRELAGRREDEGAGSPRRWLQQS